MCTGKSLSEALIFASTKPKYDNILFIELQVQYMKIPSSNLGCVQKLFLTFRTIFVHNMFSPWSAKRWASDKDLPVRYESCAVCTRSVEICSAKVSNKGSVGNKSRYVKGRVEHYRQSEVAQKMIRWWTLELNRR